MRLNGISRKAAKKSHVALREEHAIIKVTGTPSEVAMLSELVKIWAASRRSSDVMNAIEAAIQQVQAADVVRFTKQHARDEVELPRFPHILVQQKGR